MPRLETRFVKLNPKGGGKKFNYRESVFANIASVDGTYHANERVSRFAISEEQIIGRG